MDFSYVSVKHNVKLLTKMNPTLLEKAKCVDTYITKIHTYLNCCNL